MRAVRSIPSIALTIARRCPCRAARIRVGGYSSGLRVRRRDFPRWRRGFRRLPPPLRVGVWNNFVKGVSEHQHEPDPDQGRQLERAAGEPERNHTPAPSQVRIATKTTTSSRNWIIGFYSLRWARSLGPQVYHLRADIRGARDRGGSRNALRAHPWALFRRGWGRNSQVGANVDFC